MRRARPLSVVLLCAFLGLASTASAMPTWLAPTTVSDPAHQLSSYIVATTMGPSGDLATAWVETGLVAATVRSSSGSSSGRIVVVESADALTTPSVAVNASGEVAVGWQDQTKKTYEVALRPPGGAFSAPIEVAPSGGASAFFTSLALDNAGDVLVGVPFYNGSGQNATYAFRPAGGTFTPLTLNSFSTTALAPVVAMDGAGDAIVAWADKTSTGNYIVRAVRRPAGGAFGSPETLSDSAQESSAPAVAIGAGGKAAVAWTHFDGTHNRIQVSSSANPASLLSSPQTVSPAGTSSGYPSIAVSASGQMVASWSAGSTAEVAGGPVGGSLGPVTELHTPAGETQVATDAAGDAVVAWAGIEGSLTRAEAAVRSAAGATGAPVPVNSPGDTIFALANVVTVPVGMDEAGDAILGWDRFNDNTLQASIYDATPPHLALGAPTSATAGQPVGLSATTEDLFSSIASIKWSFGDGGGGEGAALTHTYASPGVYTLTVTSTDAVGNASSASRQITVTPAPAPLSLPSSPPVVVKCVVPKLKGLTSAAAKRRLLAAHCALGKVSVSRRYKHAKRLVVAAQGARVGTSLAAGTKVAVTLKPPPAPRRSKHHR